MAIKSDDDDLQVKYIYKYILTHENKFDFDMIVFSHM